MSVEANVSIRVEKDGSRYAVWDTGSCSGRVRLPPEHAANTSGFRTPLWHTLTALRAFTERSEEEQAPWRKICKATFNPLQQLLGNARAGFEYDGLCAELRTALSNVPQQFRQLQQPQAALSLTEPPKDWKRDNAKNDTEHFLSRLQATAPIYPAREMALLLRLTLDSQPADLPAALVHALGLLNIHAVFFDEAPPALREDPKYFNRTAETPVPVLVYKSGEDWMCLQSGERKSPQK